MSSNPFAGAVAIVVALFNDMDEYCPHECNDPWPGFVHMIQSLACGSQAHKDAIVRSGDTVHAFDNVAVMSFTLKCFEQLATGAKFASQMIITLSSVGVFNNVTLSMLSRAHCRNVG